MSRGENRTATRRRLWPLWLLALLVMLAAAVYQRRTGPTYPVRGTAQAGGETISYRLPRSAIAGADAAISIPAVPGLTGELRWRRLRSDDDWRELTLVREGERLHAALPAQPPRPAPLHQQRPAPPTGRGVPGRSEERFSRRRPHAGSPG